MGRQEYQGDSKAELLGFLRTGSAKDSKMEALPCLGKDAHIYSSN